MTGNPWEDIRSANDSIPAPTPEDRDAAVIVDNKIAELEANETTGKDGDAK